MADPSFLKILCDNDQTCVKAQLLVEKFNENLCHVHTETIYPLMFAAAYCVFNQFTGNCASSDFGANKDYYKRRYDDLKGEIHEDRLKKVDDFNFLRTSVIQVVGQAVDAQMKLIFSTSEFQGRLDEIATSQSSAAQKNRLEFDYIIQQANIVFNEYLATFEKSKEDV